MRHQIPEGALVCPAPTPTRAGGTDCMLAIGCLLPIVLVVAGSGIGVVLGSTTAAVWGAVAGFFLGCVGMLAMLWGIESIKHR